MLYHNQPNTMFTDSMYYQSTMQLLVVVSGKIEETAMNKLSNQNRFDLDSLFDHFLSPLSTSDPGFFSPRVDITDKGDHFIIAAELPGVDKENIHLELHNGVLTLSAEVKQNEKEEKEGRVIRQERRYGHFQRSFTVGDAVQENDITASFENGILTVTAPKAQQTEPQKRRIDIR